ncbi:MAG: hypothetical protein ACYCS2_11385 [Acidimicrobiales bacterium]
MRCKKCSKTTWAGCGRHVDQVLAGVPKADRCQGHAPEASGSGSSVLSRLLRRRVG